MPLDLAEEMCYTEEKNSGGEVPGYAETEVHADVTTEAYSRAPEESKAGIISDQAPKGEWIWKINAHRTAAISSWENFSVWF